MKLATYKDEILLKLGCPIVEVEIESLIERIVASSFREVKRYISTTKFLTIPYSEKIDIKDKKIQTVHFVMRDRSNSTESSMIDAFYLATTSMNTAGSISDYTRYLSIQQIKNTLTTDLDFTTDGDTLYVSSASPIPSSITLVYTPKYELVEEVTDEYWEDIIMRLSLANSKIILARVRGKYKNNSAIYDLDADVLLQEGTQELSELRQFLSDNFDVQLPLD